MYDNLIGDYETLVSVLEHLAHQTCQTMKECDYCIYNEIGCNEIEIRRNLLKYLGQATKDTNVALHDIVNRMRVEQQRKHKGLQLTCEDEISAVRNLDGTYDVTSKTGSATQTFKNVNIYIKSVEALVDD